jgi:hypothetical protein
MPGNRDSIAYHEAGHTVADPLAVSVGKHLIKNQLSGRGQVGGIELIARNTGARFHRRPVGGLVRMMPCPPPQDFARCFAEAGR